MEDKEIKFFAKHIDLLTKYDNKSLIYAAEAITYIVRKLPYIHTILESWYINNKEDRMDKEEDKITYKQMIELGKKQWEVAMEGDVRMLIWLGKNYLGQMDSPMHIVADEEEQPMEVDYLKDVN